ncbi:IS200/IS605 family accessory protein TnpB-related protein [Okeania sp. SIO2B3]|uniref:IS200/IS605 family accessory protein TnpB-related protein n=1 Tax=Okeania sp. SIO2B3 TaxID=2607784 RepID=UPI0025F30B5B|nr:IS200/IS605 family accessory protein TnpB-related protein [Okeania sp. SIO2B3]
MIILRIASRLIIDTLINQKIGTLIIGHNEEWKQKINLGKRNNQNFVCVPYNKLIEMLSYKAKMVGINVIITEESYTSKASFIDNDLIPIYKKGEKNHVTFSGKRIKRGLYCTTSIGLINADVNGSLNIMKKAVPNVFDHGIEKPVLWAGFPT